jgi:Protein of unknown function (DUF3592)
MNWVAVGLILIGLVWFGALTWAHLRAVGKAKAAETWPTATGKVLSRDIVVEESEDREGGTTTWYNPVVTYAYNVAGRDLEGNRLRFGNCRVASRKKAEACLAPYGAGASTAVRFNPEKPEECVLETRKPGPVYLVMAVFGLLFVAMGVFWMVAG